MRADGIGRFLDKFRRFGFWLVRVVPCVARGPNPSRLFAYNRAIVTRKPYTAKQGQYLAFIYYYTKVHGIAPAEADMQDYFKVTPPSVHQMVVTLEANRFIERIPGRGRSIRLLIPREELPDLG